MNAMPEGLARMSNPFFVVVALAVAASLGGGCAHNPPRVYGLPGASPSPGMPWKPPAKAVEKQTKMVEAEAAQAKKRAPIIPPELANNIQNLELTDIVGIALRNSKQTQQAWEQAVAAAAAYGSKRGSYLPDISADASVGWQENTAAGTVPGERSYTARGTFTWLLFNFGGRLASVEELREALFAADWTHNSAIQGVILQVEQAYYNYLATKALLAAEQATVNEAQTNVDAAEDRHSAGVATIADVLQARTALSQATLALETLQGQILTTRGALATAMGLPASTSFDVELPIGPPPVEQTNQSVEAYLDAALRNRPDLAAARARALQAKAHLRNVQANGFPSISASGTIGRLYPSDLGPGKESYNVSIDLSFPLFTGFSHHYDVAEARAQAEAARANAQSVQDLVSLQVWTSYYDLQTAAQKVKTSDDLLASATQNQEVAAGRYKAGAGSILDLLTAQTSLENARAQQIGARADWWLAVAQLAHDAGTLGASDLTGQGIDQGINQGKTNKEGKQ